MRKLKVKHEETDDVIFTDKLVPINIKQDIGMSTAYPGAVCLSLSVGVTYEVVEGSGNYNGLLYLIKRKKRD